MMGVTDAPARVSPHRVYGEMVTLNALSRYWQVLGMLKVM
jgi:hypothetical protein